MSSSGPYSISLLNDLHHHFPELLYVPQRFQSVQQVLNYIIRVAQQNPYERESTRYRSSRASSSSFSSSSSSSPSRFSFSSSSSSPPRGIPSFAQRASSSSTYSFPASSSSPHESISIHRTTIPLASMLSSSSASSSSNDDSGISLAYLASLLQLLGTGDSSNASANHPTQEEIEENSVVRMALESSQDECCSICHEGFEEGQQIRQLRHCPHSFHLTCIDTWLTSHATCPNCRRDIRGA